MVGPPFSGCLAGGAKSGLVASNRVLKMPRVGIGIVSELLVCVCQ